MSHCVPQSRSAAMTYRFTVRARPGASRTKVGGQRAGALVVAVSEPARDDRANEAVRKALAKAFGVRPYQVTIVGGHRSRDKVIEVDLPADQAEAVHIALLA